MEFELFKDYKKVCTNEKYSHINEYELDDGSLFYVEPNYYTQLIYIKDHFYDKFDEIIAKMIEVTKRNKKVIFTADFDAPVVYLDDFIYQELEDILAFLHLTFDNKSNPDSDWKD